VGGFLGRVESAISDPVCSQASMDALSCVFHQLTNCVGEILLGN